MKFDTCKRCPKNKECEKEFQKQQEKIFGAKDKVKFK